MRKFILLGLVSSAALLVAGCRAQEEAEVPGTGPLTETDTAVPENDPSIHFTAHSDALTRSAFGEPSGTTYPTYWTGNEVVGISLNYGEQDEVTITVNDAHTVADFVYTPSETAESYAFFVVTPASALQTPSQSRQALTITVPSDQKPLAGSVDESAQIFYAKTEPVTEKPSSVEVSFAHLTAYGKITLKNVTGTPIRLKLVSDQQWAGSCYVTLEDDEISVKEGAHTISLDLGNLSVADGNLSNVWFACLPASLAGKPLTVLLETSEGMTYKRTIPQLGDAMVFSQGKIINFSVNMASADAVESSARPDVLNHEVYGAYIPGNLMLYEASTDQLSREYDSQGFVTFSLLCPSQDAYVEFSGIPEQAALLDSFPLTVRFLSRGDGTYENTFQVQVVQEEGSKLWLSDGQNGFIVKR